ncbi:MAG: tyrosine-type recombinase/integrase, partial [Pyrinomonadaceae bacterium]
MIGYAERWARKVGEKASKMGNALTESIHLTEFQSVPLPDANTAKPGQFDRQLAGPFILKSLSEETRRSYERNIKEFFEYHHHRHPLEISSTDLLRWRDQMITSGKSPRTISTKLAIIRSFFEYLRAAGQIPLNPAASRLVPAPALPEDDAGRALDLKEVRHLLSGPDQSKVIGTRDYALLVFMLRTSVRVSEAANLKVSSFKWTHGRWVVKYKVKGGRERTLPIPRDVKAAIDRYLQMDEHNRQVTKTGGIDAAIFQADVEKRFIGLMRPLTTRHIWHLVRKWGKFTGVGKVTPHDLRRTAITRALDQGQTYRQVQAMSGHKNINSVVKYDRHRLSLVENAINSLDYEERMRASPVR